MIFTGEKESFISRVLKKKATEAGADCVFVPWTINEMSRNINDATLITLFMEDDERPDPGFTHYLSDMMEEKGLKIILVGEQLDVDAVAGQLSQDLVYKCFPRPVDNTEFAATVKEFFTRAASGEFRKSIMIVDDDPQYLTTIREWLKEKYKVYMANSGLQAIKMLGKSKVDLILLDHEMPVTSGPQVLEMLRSDSDTRDIPVMFLTGKGDKDSVMAVVALKPEGYFLKGIQKEELLEKLGEYFILHK